MDQGSAASGRPGGAARRGNQRTALLLACLFAPLYLVTYQYQIFGDGLTFLRRLEESTLESLTYNHLLYLPLARLLQWSVSLVSPIGAEVALEATAALAGAAGVGLTYLVAWEHLANRRRAVTCAVFLGVLQGYWFHSTVTEVHSLHTACSLVLLLALIRILRMGRGESMGRGTWILLGLGSALTPGSHVGGLCALLPIGVTFLLTPGARVRLVSAVAAGGSLFGAAYLLKSRLDTGFSGYTSETLGIYARLLAEPQRLPTNLGVWVREFATYALPAACLVPAGLRVLFRTDRRQAWQLLSWLLAWTLIALPIRDRGIGGYYIPTFPVQALLATIAYSTLAVDGRRALGVLLCAALPALVLATSEHLAGYVAVGLSSALLFALARPGTTDPRRLWLLPASALFISLLTLLPERTRDPHRERLRAIELAVQAEEARTGKPGLMVFLGTHLRWSLHWKELVHRKLKDKNRVMNPLTVDLRGNAESKALALDYLRERIESALTNGRAVWLVGSPQAVLELAPPPAVRDFLIGLSTGFEIRPAGDRLFRLVRR